MAKARQTIHEIYSREYGDATVASYRKLAEKTSSAKALPSPTIRPGRYALPIDARDVAISAGDLQLQILRLIRGPVICH